MGVEASGADCKAAGVVANGYVVEDGALCRPQQRQTWSDSEMFVLLTVFVSLFKNNLFNCFIPCLVCITVSYPKFDYFFWSIDVFIHQFSLRVFFIIRGF